MELDKKQKQQLAIAGVTLGLVAIGVTLEAIKNQRSILGDLMQVFSNITNTNKKPEEEVLTIDIDHEDITGQISGTILSLNPAEEV